MAFADSEQPADPPKKKKQLPFKRTVARKPVDNSPADSNRSKPKDENEESNIEFFRRQKDVFPVVIGEVKERATKEKSKLPDHHDRKRRKVSPESDDDTSWKKRSFGAVVEDTAARKEDKRERPIVLDDSDDDLIMDVKGKGKEIYRPSKTPTPKKPIPRPTKATFVFEDDDDDFYSAPSSRKPAAASTPTRSTRSGANNANVEISDDEPGLFETKPKIEEEPDADLEEIDTPDPYNEWVRRAEQQQLDAQDKDFAITFVVTSRLPDTRPLKVKRKIGQGMKVIMDTWVAKQKISHGIEIPDEVAASLFLTWKGKKVYKHTTPIILGVRVGPDGELLDASGEGYFDGSLHLEVWTDEAYAEYLKKKEKERKLKLGLVDDDIFGSDDKEPTPEAQKKKGIKVILKAKELEPVKCAVHDNTKVSRLVEVFRGERQIDPSQGVHIYFDGEKLDEESLVVDADIDPEETNQLEVHIR
ncbi:hypothetical protein B0T16DRAFT_359003 [Cercophora newfieldiana]|uniref:Rad60/SUMO-like domain-containing protein n=1 Tax=Cercophora newfieldiana TaxID=92897 RepID=A0AA40CLN6_9PEZI|nr:hypothetical protein B0T16DRAFT_359003 [Cercophora newfieldiana]